MCSNDRQAQSLCSFRDPAGFHGRPVAGVHDTLKTRRPVNAQRKKAHNEIMKRERDSSLRCPSEWRYASFFLQGQRTYPAPSGKQKRRQTYLLKKTRTASPCQDLLQGCALRRSRVDFADRESPEGYLQFAASGFFPKTPHSRRERYLRNALFIDGAS